MNAPFKAHFNISIRRFTPPVNKSYSINSLWITGTSIGSDGFIHEIYIPGVEEKTSLDVSSSQIGAICNPMHQANIACHVVLSWPNPALPSQRPISLYIVSKVSSRPCWGRPIIHTSYLRMTAAIAMVTAAAFPSVPRCRNQGLVWVEITKKGKGFGSLIMGHTIHAQLSLYKTRVSAWRRIIMAIRRVCEYGPHRKRMWCWHSGLDGGRVRS